MSQAGGIVRQARERSRISQRELARRAGTSQAAISRIERGLEEPTVERLERILASLGWRQVVTLEPIAELSASELRQIRDDARLDPTERLEKGLRLLEAATARK